MDFGIRDRRRGIKGDVAFCVTIAGEQEIDPDRGVHVGSGFEGLRIHLADRHHDREHREYRPHKTRERRET